MPKEFPNRPISWWTKKWGSDKLCGITHGRLRPGKNKYGTPYVITIPCGHSFYTCALIEWMLKCPTCPCCRQLFTLQDLINNL